jgi:hypothetical protein
MMMVTDDEYNCGIWYFILEGVLLGNNWVITKTWFTY